MKILIRWAFDHIDFDLRSVDISWLVSKINQTTAEIEELRSIKTDLDTLGLAQVNEVAANSVRAHCSEWGKEVVLALRDQVAVGDWYLVAKRADGYVWATTVDLGGEKEMLLPVLDTESMQKGAWKEKFETQDSLIKIDNKSITHRPDLWCHRGFALEIAALLKVPLKPLDSFLMRYPIETKEDAVVLNSGPMSIAVKDASLCRRFAGLYISKITVQPSLLWMATRLARVDSRALNAVVDATNYVMFDMGQPMHAFDADQLVSKSLTVRRAVTKERLITLDDQALELGSEDLVISDGDNPVALAGVMGGKRSGISSRTTSLFIESANFDAATIRRTSLRHKLRTEASTRFEKSLDPNQNTDAIMRFLKIFHDANISYTAADHIASLGKLAQPCTLEIAHSAIEERLGTTIAPRFVCETLQNLACEVREVVRDGMQHYQIIVPPFRATKDITIPEDIIEEVGRFYGYDSIPGVLPSLKARAGVNCEVYQVSRIKRFLAYGLSMRELYSYALFDEMFLKTIQWEPRDTVEVRDPISQQWRRLVTTLVPHLVKAVVENSVDHDRLRFFEWARCWKKEGDRIVERKSLAGIVYEKKQNIDFYDAKALLEQFFNMLGNSPVFWKHFDGKTYPWLHADQSAYLMHEEKSLGFAGRIDSAWWHTVAEGSAFIFELDGDFLEHTERCMRSFVPPSRYPAVERDVSLFAPFTLTVEELTGIIQRIDSRIEAIRLIDLFQKKEWKDHRALTVRYTVRDAHKTLARSDIDQIHDQVVKAVKVAGATVR